MPAKDIYSVIVKKGMKFKLATDVPSASAKKGDIVKITKVGSCFGTPSTGHYNDYEVLRVSNGKCSWRIDRDYLVQV